ncbi:MAG: trypsin [Sulfurovum sp.]|nr:MAG: trypsin [Sulfurovum sp.]
MQSIQIRWLLPLSFFLFISYIIFLADTADYNFAFRVVGHIPYGDKLAHALLYGLMALFLNYGLGFRQIQYKNVSVGCIKGTTHCKLHIQLGSIIVLGFAALEECSQYFIHSRTFDLWDMGADFAGVVLFSFWRIK